MSRVRRSISANKARTDTEPAQQYSATIGDRVGKLSWWFSANHLDSFKPADHLRHGPPRRPRSPARACPRSAAHSRTATRPERGSKSSARAISSIRSRMMRRSSLPMTSRLRSPRPIRSATGRTIRKPQPQTYLSTASGAPFFGAGSGSVNIGGFAYNAATLAGQFSSNDVEQAHLMQSLKVETHTQGVFDWEAVITNMDYLQDLSRLSTGLFPRAFTGGPGKTTDMGGTGWSTVDLKGTWRPQGPGGAHYRELRRALRCVQAREPDLQHGGLDSGGRGQPLGQFGRHIPRPAALWLQDRWRLAPVIDRDARRAI